MRKSVIGLGQACMSIRSKTRWAQGELAEKLNVTQMTVSRWEDTADTEILRISESVLPCIAAVLAEVQLENKIRVV